ncbi:MAG: hypothetical protein ABIP85_14045 [Chthoniobacteraceae bacterium]
MKSRLLLATIFLASPLATRAADAPALEKPVRKITPGQVIIPTEAMRRPWGELISLDLATRTGKFRNESTDEVMSFTVLPYAELLHHATLGDLQDFRVGERAIFRLHENDKGEWAWLTYIQDEMNMMNGHKEYFYVDAIAGPLGASGGTLTCMWANFDKSFIREKAVTIVTDKDTRYWKGGQPAKFADIKPGDRLRTKTHGVGKGKVRVAWEVFLDDESLAKFQTEQKTVHAKRMADEGLPGYVDASSGGELQLTLFPEGRDFFAKLKVGSSVRVAATGVDRKPSTAKVAASVTAVNAGKVTLAIPAESAKACRPAGLARVWVVEK